MASLSFDLRDAPADADLSGADLGRSLGSPRRRPPEPSPVGCRLHAESARRSRDREMQHRTQAEEAKRVRMKRSALSLRPYLSQRRTSRAHSPAPFRCRDALRARVPDEERWACKTCCRGHHCPPAPARAAAAQEEEGSVEPDDVVECVLGRGAAKAVAGALRQGKGVCAEKQEEGRGYRGGTDARAIQFIADGVQREYTAKEGDVIDELAANLVAPEAIERSRTKPLLLAAAARHLQRTRGSHPALRGISAIELLALALYTMAGPDIDALMTFADVPEHDPADLRPWREYAATKSPGRNAAIFSQVNWAMRTAEAGDKQAWSTIRRWAKYLGLLLAVCSRGSGAEGVRLSRGLAGLPADVVRRHERMKRGDCLYWPAPSSCALDPRVSESYVRGAAANACKSSGGSVLFSVRGASWGLALQAVSKYPGEAEVLLPPLSRFVVQRVTPSSARLPGTVLVDLECSGVLGVEGLSPFVASCLRDAEDASARLQTLLRRVWLPPDRKDTPDHQRHTRTSVTRARSPPPPGQMHRRLCTHEFPKSVEDEEPAPAKSPGAVAAVSPASRLLSPTKAWEGRSRGDLQWAERDFSTPPTPPFRRPKLAPSRNTAPARASVELSVV
eukprot:TRINITY_DN3966_c0_g4_i2.p1 TRINITY_DN3966_c0_g4~~TRINITY_DN3966_c0_g4_i2.p1  ORF type:complete len:639 (+),score=179.11 TRINITY_DN3966_c0_g4_i2:64-1917(+)